MILMAFIVLRPSQLRRAMSLARRFRAEHLSALRHRLSGSASFLICTAALMSACGEAPEPVRDVSQPSGGTSAGVIDWDARTISFHSPGWTLEFCEGEGPFLCVERGDEHVGSVELLRFPVESHTAIAGVLGRGGSELEALKAAAAEFVAGLTADRRIGVGEEYQLQADSPAATTVMGKQGLHLVVEGGLGGEIHVRIVQYYVIQDDSVYLLAATGMAGGGQLGEFAIHELKVFEPLLGNIAAVSRVSTTTP